MIDKVKELRNIVPIAMTQALQFLKENEGDVEKCVYLFKTQCIKHIRNATNCDEQTAIQHFEAEKMDINRTISAIREKTYDDTYQKIDGLSIEGLVSTNEWLDIISRENFDISMNYPKIDLAIDTLKLIPPFEDIALNIQNALIAKRQIFGGYNDKDPLVEFVRRSKLLDDNPDFRKAYETLPLKVIVMKEEILRHLRNMRRLTQS